MSTIDFTDTQAYRIVKTFIFQIDNSIKNEVQQELPDDFIIFRIRTIIENTPLSETKGRYANPGMIEAIEKIEKACDSEDVKKTFDEEEMSSKSSTTCRKDEERMKYLRNSFGNKTRMDFGTGHELNFLCFLYTYVKDGLIATSQVSSILKYYFETVRLFIKKFNIEAAGSRGCWSIDDYLLLPYLFESSVKVKEEMNKDKRSDIRSEIFYSSKSPVLLRMLNKGWKEINNEMIRTYDETVLQRRVVTQHFIYSKYLPE